MTTNKPTREGVAASPLDSIRDAMELFAKYEMIVAANPADVTDEFRAQIAKTPLARLKESRFVPPGKVFCINPALLEDLNAPS